MANNNNGNGAPQNEVPNLVNALAGSNLRMDGHTDSRALAFQAQYPPGVEARAFQGNQSVEALLGEGCIDWKHFICDRARMIPGIAGTGPFVLVSADYPVIGTVGQLRASTEALFARGRNYNNPTPMSLTGGNLEASFVPDGYFGNQVGQPPFVPLSMGFVIDWGLPLLNFTPFDMRIQSEGFIGEDGQTLDRDLVVRINKPAGSSLFVPWASRVSPGMAFAQNQLAKPSPEDEGPTAFVRIVAPPSPIDNFLNVQVRLMTAFSPAVAAYSALIGLYGNIVGPVMTNHYDNANMG